MQEKSEHKQAWQTAQRALAVARNAEALALSPPPRRLTFLQKMALLATIAAGAVTVLSSGVYTYYPSMEVRALDGDLSTNPLFAKFEFRNSGRLALSNVKITCTVDFPKGGHLVLSGVLFDGIGLQVGTLYPSSPPIIRTCNDPNSRSMNLPAGYPAHVTLDVRWYGLPIGHQYFISQPTQNGASKMVPESDPIP
jgi:hypothetical protein